MGRRRFLAPPRTLKAWTGSAVSRRAPATFLRRRQGGNGVYTRNPHAFEQAAQHRKRTQFLATPEETTSRRQQAKASFRAAPRQKGSSGATS